MEIIKTENLRYVYSPKTTFEKVAIDNVNITVNQGEFIGIIGHTGSGKSTLVQHLNGLIKPTSGRVIIDGVDIHQKGVKLRDIRFKVGLVFQYPEHQLFDETVFKDIAYGPRNMGLSDDEIKSRVLSAAKFTGLPEELLYKSPFDLSGGQKRRAAIAGVMAMSPKVIILDEPTAGLDPESRSIILEHISEYRKKTGTTVLLVSHSMEDIAEYADRVLVMNNSKLFMYDTVEKVFEKSDELTKIGLEVPEVTRILNILKANGLPVKNNIYTVEQAVRELEALFSEARKK